MLHDVVRRVTDAIDGDGGTKSEAELFDRRRYHASRSLDNLLNVNGLFDPESADIHEAAIAAEMNATYAATKTAHPPNGAPMQSRTCSANR